MRIALLVDGDAEQRSLGRLYRQLHEQTGHTFLRPAQSRIQPLGPANLIALACLPELRKLGHERIDRVVVLVDRER